MRAVHAAIVAGLVSACGASPPPPAPKPTPTDGERAFVAEAEAVEAAACGCKDADCFVAAISKERWDLVFRTAPDGLSLTDDGAARYGRAYLNASRCAHALLAGPEPSGDSDDAKAALRALREVACACQDVACVDQVMVDFIELGERFKDAKGSNEDVDEFKRDFDQMQACISAIKGEPPAP